MWNYYYKLGLIALTILLFGIFFHVMKFYAADLFIFNPLNF